MFATVKSFPVGTIVKPIMKPHIQSNYSTLRVVVTRDMDTKDRIAQYGIVICEPDLDSPTYKFGQTTWIEPINWEAA